MRGIGKVEAPPGDRLEHLDIEMRGFGDDFARDRRDRVAIRIATRRHPAPDKILVEAFGRLAALEPRLIALGEPIAAAVRGVDLVGQHNGAVAVKAELVLGVDQDQPVLQRNFAPAREQRQGQPGDSLPLL